MEKHSQDKTCFQQEMAIHNQLKHPHIIEMFASQATDNFLYLFMEYAPRGNLLDRIGNPIMLKEITDVNTLRQYSESVRTWSKIGYILELHT